MSEPISADPSLSATPHVISVDHGDRTVLLNAESEEYFSLNSTGRAVWSLLCDGTTRTEIVHTLVSRFTGDAEQISADVNALLEKMFCRGLISQK
jgi:hypothetical protein